MKFELEMPAGTKEEWLSYLKAHTDIKKDEDLYVFATLESLQKAFKDIEKIRSGEMFDGYEVDTDCKTEDEYMWFIQEALFKELSNLSEQEDGIQRNKI